MAPTTTIRIPDDLKARITRAASEAGTSVHSFILEAVADKADMAERRADFLEEAENRYAEIVATGKSVGWKDMRHYMEQRAAGRRPPKPKARKLTAKA